MIKLEWHNEKRKISDLIPYESNPRQITEKQYSDLKKSVTKFNLAEIPAINIDNKICAGHQRLKAMSEVYGNDFEIDVRVPNRKLTEKEFKEYNVRSNKNTAEWQFDILANEFENDELIEWGFEDFELGIEEYEKPIKKEILNGYNKIHFLISIDPEDLYKIEKQLSEIKSMEGMEFEQSAN